MQVKRFLSNIAKTSLAFGALSASAFVGADEYPYHPGNAAPYGAPYGAPYAGCDVGCPPHGCASDCCFGSSCNEPPCLSYGYNPPFTLCGNGCNANSFIDNLSIRADFLWWRASADGTAFGVETSTQSLPIATSTNGYNSVTERLKRPDFKFDPGFRLGISNYCPCDGWDLALNWTHYHTKANAYGYIDEDTTFFTFWQPSLLFLQDLSPDFAEAKYTLDLDLLDFELARKYYVSSNLVLRPYIGLRGVRANQGYETFFGNDENDPFLIETKAKDDFLAIGPRVGISAEFHVGCGFSIFGEGAGSLVYGRFSRHGELYGEDFPLNQEAQTFYTRELDFHTHNNAYRTSRAITDLSIGLKWDHCFSWCNHTHPVSIALSWEHHGFYGFTNFEFDDVLEISNNEGDLYTQGLTLTANIGF